MRRFRLVLAAVLCFAYLMASPTARAEDDAQKVFDAVYGERLTQVRDTVTTKDDLELVEQMLAGAAEAQDAPKLALIICQTAYDLASRTPAGYDQAISAAQMLADLAPERRAEVMDNILTLRQRQYVTSRSPEKETIGASLITLMVDEATNRLAAGDYEGATTLYRQATLIANQVKSPRAEELKLRYEAGIRLDRARDKVKRLGSALEADPKDTKAAEELVETIVVDMNRPMDLKPYVAILPAGELKDRAVLLTTPREDLKPAQAIELADYYRDLAKHAPTDRRYALLATAVDFFNGVQSSESASATERARAQLTISQIKPQMDQLEAAGLAVRPLIGGAAGDRWTVIFRSNQARDWGRKLDSDERFALPLEEAPKGVRYLRLKRMDSGDYVIVPMTNERLGQNTVEKDFGFNGARQYSYGAYRLGVYKADKEQSVAGNVHIANRNYGSGFQGWGLGNVHSGPYGQGYSWDGATIAATAFEVAVSTAPLAVTERTKLLYDESLVVGGTSSSSRPSIGAAASDERWTVIFRSDDVTKWNKDVDDRKDYAVSLSKVADDIKFLRLRRVDTRQLLIIPISKARLGRISAQDGIGWAGGERHWGSIHLGVYKTDWSVRYTTKGQVAMTGDLITTYRGWGVGRVLGVENTQSHTWNGSPLPRPVIFEIAVTSTDLTPVEKRLMAK